MGARRRGARAVDRQTSVEQPRTQHAAVLFVGESGSGKSMATRAIPRTLPDGGEVAGAMRFGGEDVTRMDARALLRFAAGIGMIFQDSRAHLDPLRRIGDFMVEPVVTGVESAACGTQNPCRKAT